MSRAEMNEWRTLQIELAFRVAFAGLFITASMVGDGSPDFHVAIGISGLLMGLSAVTTWRLYRRWLTDHCCTDRQLRELSRSWRSVQQARTREPWRPFMGMGTWIWTGLLGGEWSLPAGLARPSPLDPGPHDSASADMAFARAVRNARDRLQLTQETVAARAGVSVRTCAGPRPAAG